MAGLTRPQVLAFVAGVLQMASSVLDVPDIGTPHRVLQMCTGLLGLVLAWRREHARLYGAGLVVGYGAVADAGVAEDALLLHLRVVLAGFIIMFVPVGRTSADST